MRVTERLLSLGKALIVNRRARLRWAKRVRPESNCRYYAGDYFFEEALREAKI
jgi:hypothetical protein